MTRGLGDINALIVNKLFRLGKPAYNKTKWTMLFMKRKMESRRLRGGQAILGCRVAQSARSGKRGSLIPNDLVDSKDSKHMLLCRETAFVTIYGLFRGNIPILRGLMGGSTRVPKTLLACRRVWEVSTQSGKFPAV